MKQLYFLFLNFMSLCYASDGTFKRLVIESESETGQSAKFSDARLTAKHDSYYRSQCIGSAECVPLTECSEMLYEAARSCYTGDRTMFCGATEYETYVCCPRITNDGRSVCGKSLVQGPKYKGLGAYPFVARIGFKSTVFSY